MSAKPCVDWAEIHRRLEATRLGMEEKSARSPGQERQILKTRAQELAREPKAKVSGGTLEVVEFDLANERYAFALERVQEVCLLKELTPVPCTPAFVLGIVNLRGEIRTVIDLKVFFDLPARGLTDLNKIIILQHTGIQLGILADAIRGVRSIPLDQLQPAMPTLTGIRADYLRGLTGDRLVVLDAIKILSDPRLLVEDQDER